LLAASTAVLVLWVLLEAASGNEVDWEENYRARRGWNEKRRQTGLPTMRMDNVPG
jgi:hypothetical protein